MADPKEEDTKPPIPNPEHPGHPKTAEQLKADQEAQKRRDEEFKKSQAR